MIFVYLHTCYYARIRTHASARAHARIVHVCKWTLLGEMCSAHYPPPLL